MNAAIDQYAITKGNKDRLELRLIFDIDGKYRWYTLVGSATEASALFRDQAERLAVQKWPGITLTRLNNAVVRMPAPADPENWFQVCALKYRNFTPDELAQKPGERGLWVRLCYKRTAKEAFELRNLLDRGNVHWDGAYYTEYRVQKPRRQGA